MPSTDCHRHGLFDMLARYVRNRSLLSQLMLLMLLTVTVITGPSLLLFSFSLCPPSVFLLCQAWGYFAWSEGFLRRQSIKILIAAHPQICEYMAYSKQCGKQTTQQSLKLLLKGRHSLCDSHHVTILLLFFLETKWCMLLSDIRCPQSSVA